MIKKILSILILTFIFLLLALCLTGCTTEKQITISTNNFIQTDYDYKCLNGDKTFTQIIVCYQAQDKAEKAQNKLTNEMIQESLNTKN